MDEFFPFIHQPKRKKENEPQPLYVELYPPMPEKHQENKEEETERVIIIEL